MKKLLLIACLLMSMGTWATPLTALLNGGSITVGDKLFDQWGLLRDISTNPFDVNTDDIEVTGLPDGGLEPGPGLHFEIFNDALTIEGDGIFAFLDFMFTFRVSVLDPSMKIKDNSLFLTDYELTNPTSVTSVFIEEKIYSDANEVGTKDVEVSNILGVETEKLFDSAEFTPTDEIWVTKNILLEAWDIGESASLRSFEQRFSQVQTDIPEPTSLLLLSVGLLGFLVTRNQL